jgi:hypothetical protein
VASEEAPAAQHRKVFGRNWKKRMNAGDESLIKVHTAEALEVHTVRDTHHPVGDAVGDAVGVAGDIVGLGSSLFQ